jgi:hypothetical protein
MGERYVLGTCCTCSVRAAARMRLAFALGIRTCLPDAISISIKKGLKQTFRASLNLDTHLIGNAR